MQKYFIIVFILLFSQGSFAKLDSLIKPQVRFSPTMIANLVTQEKNYVKLTYGQPYRKGREIFGNLVPYNELWRLGANEATELTVSKDFEFGGKVFNAGTYTLFAIPKNDKWEFIVNSKLGQWGIFEYDESLNIHRFEVDVRKISNIYEGFTIELEEKATNIITVGFYWDNISTKVILKLIDKTEVLPVLKETPRQKRKRLRKSKS